MKAELASAIANAALANQWELVQQLTHALRQALAADNSEPRAVPQDPMGDWLTGKAPTQRADTLQVFHAWRKVAKQPHARLQRGDLRAEAISKAIDANGVDWCLTVLAGAQYDDMVTGKADARGQSHWSPTYLFRPDVADRLYAAAVARREAEARRAKELAQSAAESRLALPEGPQEVAAEDIEQMVRALR